MNLESKTLNLQEEQKITLKTHPTLVEHSAESLSGDQTGCVTSNTPISAHEQSSQPDLAPSIKSSPEPESTPSEQPCLKSSANDELIAMALNPETAEHQWISACTELNLRNVTYDSKNNTSGSIKRNKTPLPHKLLFAASAIVLGIGAATAMLWHPAHRSPVSQPIVHTVPAQQTVSESLRMGQSRTHFTQESLGMQLANAIAKIGWTPAEAAEHLNIDKTSISDLLNGRPDAIPIDKELALLSALNEPIDVSNPRSEKNSQTAVDYYSRILTAQPTNEEAYLRRADGYRGLGQYELVLADYARCLDIDPSSRNALIGRAGLYNQLHRYGESLQDSKRLIALFPDRNDGYMMSGIAYQAKGNYAEAVKQYDQVIQLGTHVIAPYLRRAETYEQQGKLKEAIADYEQAAAMNPDYVESQENIVALKKKLYSVTPQVNGH